MATYKGKDQLLLDEATTYWFDVVGEIFGVAESIQGSIIIHNDGYPVSTHDHRYERLRPLIDLVTDEMRQA